MTPCPPRPKTAAVAVLTLVLAIGANTAIFRAVSAVLLRPLPYPDADRLAAIWGTLGDSPRVLLSSPDLIEYRGRSRALDDLGIIRQQSVNLTGGDRPDRLSGCFVTANAFRLFGARAELGVFAVCIDNADYPASLEARKLYEVLPGEAAASHHQLRVLDESGEDSLERVLRRPRRHRIA